jgi:hypothetical protein
MENEQISDILFLDRERSSVRSCHLVLWSLETLTDQHRFYGTGLVTRKERNDHPLNVLPEAS